MIEPGSDVLCIARGMVVTVTDTSNNSSAEVSGTSNGISGGGSGSIGGGFGSIAPMGERWTASAVKFPAQLFLEEEEEELLAQEQKRMNEMAEEEEKEEQERRWREQEEDTGKQQRVRQQHRTDRSAPLGSSPDDDGEDSSFYLGEKHHPSGGNIVSLVPVAVGGSSSPTSPSAPPLGGGGAYHPSPSQTVGSSGSSIHLLSLHQQQPQLHDESMSSVSLLAADAMPILAHVTNKRPEMFSVSVPMWKEATPLRPQEEKAAEAQHTAAAMMLGNSEFTNPFSSCCTAVVKCGAAGASFHQRMSDHDDKDVSLIPAPPATLLGSTLKTIHFASVAVETHKLGEFYYDNTRKKTLHVVGTDEENTTTTTTTTKTTKFSSNFDGSNPNIKLLSCVELVAIHRSSGLRDSVFLFGDTAEMELLMDTFFEAQLSY